MVHGRVSVYRAEGIHTTEFCSKTEQHGDRTVSSTINNCIQSAHTHIYPNKSTQAQLNMFMQINCFGFLNREDQIWEIPPQICGWKFDSFRVPLAAYNLWFTGVSNGKSRKQYSHKSHRFLSITTPLSADSTFLCNFWCLSSNRGRNETPQHPVSLKQLKCQNMIQMR